MKVTPLSHQTLTGELRRENESASLDKVKVLMPIYDDR
jgi:hypothetical protein